MAVVRVVAVMGTEDFRLSQVFLKESPKIRSEQRSGKLGEFGRSDVEGKDGSRRWEDARQNSLLSNAAASMARWTSTPDDDPEGEAPSFASSKTMCFPSLSRDKVPQTISPGTETPAARPAPQGLGPAYTSAEYNAYWSQQYQAQPSIFLGRLFEPASQRAARQAASGLWEGLAKDTQISVGYGTGPPDPDVEAREGRGPKVDQEQIRRVDTPPAGAILGQAL